MKRVGWGLLFLFVAPSLHALDVQVGSSFKISGITRQEGKVVFPRTHKKYYDIRVLNQDTLSFVQTCSVPCIEPLADSTPVINQLRAARAPKELWIVSVAFARAWLITFLVGKEEDKWQITSPAHFTFLDSVLEQRTHKLILQAVERERL